MYDFIRLFQITTVYGFSAEPIPEDLQYRPVFNKDIGTIMEDFKTRNDKTLKKVFDDYLLVDDQNIKSKTAGLTDFMLVLRAFFQESTLKNYLASDDSEEVYDKVNSYKILISKMDDFFFRAIKVNPQLYKNSKFINMDYNSFWDVLSYLYNSESLHLV